MKKLEGKVAIVTGAGRGIGKATALKLAGEGADILVCDLNVPNMEATASEIKALGRRAIISRTDVSIKSEVEAMVDLTLNSFKKVDILINNAGIIMAAPFLEMTEQQWEKVMAVDLKGVFFCMQAVGKHFIQQKSGKIVSLSSVVAMGATYEDQPNYAAAKMGIIALTRVAAKALGRFGVNVNAVAPGLIKTDIQGTWKSPTELEAHLESRRQAAAMGRIGNVDDVANLILYLVSDESSFITGQVISVDGGRMDKM